MKLPSPASLDAHPDTREIPRLRTPDETPLDELVQVRLAIEASGEVVFMTDPNGVFTYVNPEFVRVYGYTPPEVIGRHTPRILGGGKTPPEEYAALWRDLMAGRIVKREFVNKTKSGALVHIESSANPIVGKSGVIGFLAVQRDITARKLTEEALIKSEQRYRALAEAAHDAIFIVNPDQTIQYSNATGAALFGVRGREMAGRRLQEVFPSSVAEEMWRELSRVFQTGQAQFFETRFDLPKGELWLGTWLVPMSGAHAIIDGVMGVARDITRQKSLEREYLQAQKMEAVGLLAGGVAHDFNNLLTAILGYCEFLRDRLHHDSELTADLEEIRKAGERAGALTRQLLAFSRKQMISPEVVNLNGLVADLEKMLVRIIGEDVHLDTRIEPDLWHVLADPHQIEQLVVNLAVNARDAMPSGGTLRISTANVTLDQDFVRRHNGAKQGLHVSLTVRDEGHGMSAEVLAHAFEPFFTTKPTGRGTGLGLSTVYGIVKQSGGFISIESAPGAGTTVTTYLPAAGPAVHSHDVRGDQTESIGGMETILLVEDESSLRRLMSKSLERYGYTVLIADDAERAVALTEQYGGTIDLLLTDVVMPGMSGPDLAERLLRQRPSMKTLFISGFTTHPIFAGLGSATRLLPKPFTPHVLATAVRACLDSVQQAF